MKRAILLLLLFAGMLPVKMQAQQCPLSVAAGGVHFTSIYLGIPGYVSGITGGDEHNYKKGGYVNDAATPAGTSKAGNRISIPLNIYNPSDSAVAVNIRVFVDWDDDDDFNDSNEVLYDFDYRLEGNTSFSTNANWVNATKTTSTVRLRFAVREGGSKATPCGNYTGAVEDYTIEMEKTNNAVVTRR